MLHVIRKCLKLVKQGNNQWLLIHVQFSSVQSLSRVQLFATPWNAAHQASLSITSSQSPPKPMSIESVMPSNHLSPSVVPFSFCRPLLFLPSIFPRSGSFQMSQLFASGGQSIGVSASTSVLPMNIKDRSPLGWYFVFFIVLKLHNYGRETSLITFSNQKSSAQGEENLSKSSQNVIYNK